MILRKSYFKAAEEKSTRNSKSALRDTALTTVLFVTLNQGFEHVGRMLGEQVPQQFLIFPPKRNYKTVLTQKQP